MKLKIVKVSTNYCNYLRQFDSKVSYNYGLKENRPYVGVLFRIKNFEYFAPLSSPKAKHLKMPKSIDYMKIDAGKLGIVNFNNMIPLLAGTYEIINFNLKNVNVRENQYHNLLRKQYVYLNKHLLELQEKSFKLYYLYCHNYLDNKIKSRCCNYPLLEEKSKLYKKDSMLIG